MKDFFRHRDSLARLAWLCFPYLLLLALSWYEIATILALNQGHFTYSLDDPYIHLALAGRIAAGSYGINPGEVAAPASSILWPFLLAPLAGLPRFDLVPLAYNLLFALATVFVYTKIASFLLPQERVDGSAAYYARVAAITLPLILTTNLVGLAFTGMEHSLQVFLCAAVILGILQVLNGRAAPAWLVAALIAAPLVRYETLAVTLPALAVLVLRRRWKASLLALGGALLGLGAFSLFLAAHGLGWLPTSVFAKVGFADYRPTHNFILDHIRYNLQMAQGKVLAALLLALLWLAVARRNTPWSERALGLLAAGGVLAHLAAGQIGWMDRYEVYMITAAVIWVLYLGRDLLGWLFGHLGALTTAALLLVASFFTGGPYYADIATTPLAAVNIYEQQYQMHRFAVDYLKAPVAVNDLGWVAYRNPHYVLDLWGLASAEALKARTSAGPYRVNWMASLVSQRGIRLVMIYTAGWFPVQPAGWTPVARLHLGHPRVIAGGDTVAFFVPDPQTVESVRGLLRAFAPTLPPGVRLEILP